MGKGDCESMDAAACGALFTDCSYDCSSCDCGTCDWGSCNCNCGNCFFCGSFSPNGDTPCECNIRNWLCFACFIIIAIFVCSISPVMKAFNAGRAVEPRNTTDFTTINSTELTMIMNVTVSRL